MVCAGAMGRGQGCEAVSVTSDPHCVSVSTAGEGEGAASTRVRGQPLRKGLRPWRIF